MKPILHIVNNPDDTQAIEMIKTQGKDNAYGVAAVFVGEIPSVLPSMPDVRICVLRENEAPLTLTLSREGRGDSSNISPPLMGGDKGEGENSGFEVIGYDDLLNLIFSVETITVW